MRHLVGTCVVVASVASGWTVALADPEVQAIAITTGLVVAAAIGTPTREEPNLFAIAVGRFDPIDNVQPATTFGLEYRIGQLLWWKLRPFVGAGFTTQHSFYGYGGIRLATYWGERIIVTPSFAVGAYSSGAGKNLGNPPVVGRFGLDLEYRCDSDMRVGIAYHHVSNGKLLGQANNPGTEIVSLTLSIPVQ